MLYPIPRYVTSLFPIRYRLIATAGMLGSVMSLRNLPLPPGIPGKVFLSRMPGRTGNFAADRDEIVAAGIDTVICLAPMSEVESRAIDYATAIKYQDLPWKQVMAPMADMGLPDDRDAWLMTVRSASNHLREGGAIMVHCAFGIGRTGTTAIALLLTLAMTLSDATIAVIGAGSEPEDPRQWDLLHWAAGLMGLDY